MVIDKNEDIFVANRIRKRVKIIFLVAHVMNYRKMTSLLLCVRSETDAHQESSCWSVCQKVLISKQMITTDLFPSGFCNLNVALVSDLFSYVCCMSHPYHSLPFVHLNCMWWSIQYPSVMSFSPPSLYFFSSSLLGRNIFLSSGVPWGGGWGFNPPRNSEGPPKSCQTEPDCENC